MFIFDIIKNRNTNLIFYLLLNSFLLLLIFLNVSNKNINLINLFYKISKPLKKKII